MKEYLYVSVAIRNINVCIRYGVHMHVKNRTCMEKT